MLYGCRIYTVPHLLFQHSSLCISPLRFLSSGCSKLPQSMLYCRTTQAVPDIGFLLLSLHMLASESLPAILRLPSTSWTADPKVARHTLFPTSVPAFVPSLFGSAPQFPMTLSLIPARCYQCFSVALHTLFPTLVPASSLCISAARPPSSAFIHASVHLAQPNLKLRRRPDALPSSPYHDLHYQYPTPHT